MTHCMSSVIYEKHAWYRQWTAQNCMHNGQVHVARGPFLQHKVTLKKKTLLRDKTCPAGPGYIQPWHICTALLAKGVTSSSSALYLAHQGPKSVGTIVIVIKVPLLDHYCLTSKSGMKLI